MSRSDIATARLICALANINRNPKKRSKPFEVTDFMPDWGAGVADDDDGQSVLEQVGIAAAYAQMGYGTLTNEEPVALWKPGDPQ